jgi:hypothetical protein
VTAMGPISPQSEAFYREEIDSIDPQILAVELIPKIAPATRLWIILICGLLCWLPFLVLACILRHWLAS